MAPNFPVDDASTPNPIVFDVKYRISQLYDCLNPRSPVYQRVEQHQNIKAVIHMYETGKINGEESVWVMQGKIVSQDEAYQGPDFHWHEGVGHQMLNKYAYGRGVNRNFHDVST